MFESCWDILGIGITTDKLEIKKAFAKLAHQISPEDDPDGYRRIHTAYKQALEYASHAKDPKRRNGEIPGAGITISRRVLPYQGTKFPKQEDAAEESEAEKENEGFDFTSVEKPDLNKKSKKAKVPPRPSSRTQVPKEDDEKKQSFDFSPIVQEEKQFSDEIERIIEQIVTYKEENGIDTPENVKRWKVTTLDMHGMKLLKLYGSLFMRSGETSTWNVFFKEPLMKQMLYNQDFRHKIRTYFPSGSESRTKIEELIEEFEDQLALEEAEREKTLTEKDKKEQIVIACLVVFGIFFIFALELFLQMIHRH
ncbi:MAG: hypothetical protein IKX68_06320 [Clostridiales bacterium]|nr:hypothetical protein [Clostridiales bacterium]